LESDADFIPRQALLSPTNEDSRNMHGLTAFPDSVKPLLEVFSTRLTEKSAWPTIAHFSLSVSKVPVDLALRTQILEEREGSDLNG
jgi:hypothetical protein